MGKPSWVRTVITQLSLCLAVLLAFNLGRPWEKPMSHSSSGSSRPLDLYFISVRGGFRPLNQQTHLLKQTYKARFVINISELGKTINSHNGTWRFSTLKVPWYSTRVSRGRGTGYFLKQIKIPFGKTLDIIGLDTGPFKHLHHIFYKFGVDVYLSGEGCSDYARKDSIAYIRNPGSIDEKLPLASVNGISGFSEGMVNGFLLHRVSSLEIETYFVNSAGEVVHDIVLQQRGARQPCNFSARVPNLFILRSHVKFLSTFSFYYSLIYIPFFSLLYLQRPFYL
ncbi:hypothetical protein AAG906_011350 [Vitis piasezkii]